MFLKLSISPESYRQMYNDIYLSFVVGKSLGYSLNVEQKVREIKPLL